MLFCVPHPSAKIIILPEEEPIVAQPAFMINPDMAHEVEEQEKHAAASKIQAKYRGKPNDLGYVASGARLPLRAIERGCTF